MNKILMKKIPMKKISMKKIEKKNLYIFLYIKMVNKYYQKKQRKALKRSTQKISKSF